MICAHRSRGMFATPTSRSLRGTMQASTASGSCRHGSEMVLRDEHAVIPIGSYQREFGVTLTLPSVVGSEGIVAVMQPVLSAEEGSALERSVERLRRALERARS